MTDCHFDPSKSSHMRSLAGRERLARDRPDGMLRLENDRGFAAFT